MQYLLSNLSRILLTFGIVAVLFTFASQAHAQVDPYNYDYYNYDEYGYDTYGYDGYSYDSYAYADSYNYGNSYYALPAYPTYGAPSCTISVSQYGGNSYGSYGNQLATLSWNAYNAQTVSIYPNVGTVTPSGSVQVYPINGQVYTMTVYGQGGYTTCATQPFYATSYPGGYYQSPYITLTQIPYTGLEIGALGNALFVLAAGIFLTALVYLAHFFVSKRQ